LKSLKFPSEGSKGYPKIRTALTAHSSFDSSYYRLEKLF